MKHWIVQVKDGLANFTLKTGKKGNRLTPETFAELNSALFGLNLGVVRGLILDAEGDDFSQGFDLSFLLAADSSDERFLKNLFSVCNQALDRLYNLPIPSISMVKGSCIGGGLLIFLATDFRVADEKAKFCFPEVKQSMVVNFGLKRVYQLVGESRTKELVMLGNPVSASTMQNWGIINWLTCDGDFNDRMLFFKKYIDSIPPLAIRANKELIQKLPILTMDESVDLENNLQMKVVRSADFKEAIHSFLNNRKPIFKGK